MRVVWRRYRGLIYKLGLQILYLQLAGTVEYVDRISQEG